MMANPTRKNLTANLSNKLPLFIDLLGFDIIFVSSPVYATIPYILFFSNYDVINKLREYHSVFLRMEPRGMKLTSDKGSALGSFLSLIYPEKPCD